MERTLPGGIYRGGFRGMMGEPMCPLVQGVVIGGLGDRPGPYQDSFIGQTVRVPLHRIDSLSAPKIA